MIKGKIKISIVLAILLVPFIFVQPVSADHSIEHCIEQAGLDTNVDRNVCIANIGTNSGADSDTTSTYSGTGSFAPLNAGGLETDRGEPIENNSIYVRLAQIINVLSVGVGIVITASIVFAGIQYTSSRGDPNKTQKAISRIWQAGIALVLYIFGWTILNWLIPGGVLN